MSTDKFSDRIMKFNRNLSFTGKLPAGIAVMNPFRENPLVLDVANAFYQKFFADNHERHLILGINPGRLGAGATGIPFTDPKRLASNCGIEIPGIQTHEPSSVFVYKVIDAFGGPEIFYQRFYISSICPLGFIKEAEGKMTNYNYYDSPALMKSVRPFVVKSLKQQLDFGVNRKECFCFGTGKNFKFIHELNEEYHFFEKVTALEHPRYIMQYKSKEMDFYLDHYLNTLNNQA
jgi:hypothetical protein